MMQWNYLLLSTVAYVAFIILVVPAQARSRFDAMNKNVNVTREVTTRSYGEVWSNERKL